MALGDRLKFARESIGYRQDQVAKKSGIGISSLSEFENNKREPRFSQLSKLAEIYRRTIDFFLREDTVPEGLMLWRDKPEALAAKEAEAQFRQYCEQFHRLEQLMGEVRFKSLPAPDVRTADELNFDVVDTFARRIINELRLGDRPALSLQKALEEDYCIKIFHLRFEGSAISVKSEFFGAAILLNKSNRCKAWRRHYDLAHELFHLFTWDLFRKDLKDIPSDREEKLANAFASRLLLPTDSVKPKIDALLGPHKELNLQSLDVIAREFGVSLDALLWRLVYLYNVPSEKVPEYIEKSKQLSSEWPARNSDQPDELPERYCGLAIRALRAGRLSLLQFSKYMNISYRDAQRYLPEEEGASDEEISISVA